MNNVFNPKLKYRSSDYETLKLLKSVDSDPHTFGKSQTTQDEPKTENIESASMSLDAIEIKLIIFT